MLLFGGSNTQLFPEHVLEGFLNEREQVGAAARWEVINLGRAGYGSGRVLSYLAQAMQLEPDVVVIYSGHNEFVEADFAAELGLEDGAPQTWNAHAAAWLRPLRMYRVLEAAFQPTQASQDAWAEGREAGEPGAAPSPREPMSSTVASLDPDDVRARYTAYRQNLDAMCVAAAKAGAEVLLLTPVGNLLAAPSRIRFVDWADQKDLPAGRRDDLLRTLMVMAHHLPARFAPWFLDDTPLRVHDWYDAKVDGVAGEAFTAPALRPLAAPLADAPALDDERRYATVAGAHWPDPALWGRAARERVLLTADLLARDLTPAERAALERCRDEFRKAIDLSRQMPTLLYSSASSPGCWGRTTPKPCACCGSPATGTRRRAS